MDIEQRQFRIHQRISFSEDQCRLSSQTPSGLVHQQFNYADLSEQSSSCIDAQPWLACIGWLWIGLSLIQLLELRLSSQPAALSLLLALGMGIICLSWYWLDRHCYSLFQTERGSIRILRGRQHDQILQQLRSRRKQQLLRWYGEINPDNEFQHELRKFHWLAEQGVISDEERDHKIAELEFHHYQQQHDWLH